jgi:hypothetical protein
VAIADIPSNVSTGSGVLTLVVPLGLLVIVLLWGWTLRRRLP